METVRGDVRANFLCGPAGALVGVVLDYFELDSGRMIEANELLSKAFLNAAILDLVPIQMFEPEFDRALGHRIGGRLDLSGTLTASDASIRKGGVNRARLRVRVRIVQMIMSVAAIKEDGLLDHALAENLRLEVDVFLRASYTYGHVMDTFYERHGPLPPPGF